MNTHTLTIEQFCNRHDACADGREWALANCKDLTEVWQTAKPEWLLWVATQPGVLADRELRLFAVYCARSVEHLLTDERSHNAIDVAERHAHGKATDDELVTAWAAARAAEGAARAAEGAAAWAARAAARAAEGAAEGAAARAVGAAWAARAVGAAWAARAAEGAARAAQSAWLRENTKPFAG
jgi:hypothetical protein